MTCKKVQSSGVCNLYSKFVRDFSRVAAPVTKLSSSIINFSWTLEANGSFANLKFFISSAPELIHPDPIFQFITIQVEVDAADVHVGAVLSQCPVPEQKL